MDENRGREETSPPAGFATPELVEQVSAALTETEMDLPDLALQITGSVIMEQWLPAEDIIGALMNPGVTLPIDPFGIGYASITYFESLLVDTPRMDRSMVERVYEVAERSRRDLGGRLGDHGPSVCAGPRGGGRGSGNRGGLYELRSMGCDLTQGYYRQRPCSTEKTAEPLTAGSNPQSEGPVRSERAACNVGGCPICGL